MIQYKFSLRTQLSIFQMMIQLDLVVENMLRHNAFSVGQTYITELDYLITNIVFYVFSLNAFLVNFGFKIFHRI